MMGAAQNKFFSNSPDFPSAIDAIVQGYTDALLQVTATTRFSTVVPHICVFPVWNLLHFSLLAPRIASWLLDWWKNCGPAR